MGLLNPSPRHQQCLPEAPFAVYRGLLRSREALEGKTTHLQSLVPPGFGI